MIKKLNIILIAVIPGSICTIDSMCSIKSWLMWSSWRPQNTADGHNHTKTGLYAIATGITATYMGIKAWSWFKVYREKRLARKKAHLAYTTGQVIREIMAKSLLPASLMERASLVFVFYALHHHHDANQYETNLRNYDNNAIYNINQDAAYISQYNFTNL